MITKGAFANGELLFEQIHEIGIVTLNRPDARNALTFGMYGGLQQICVQPPEGVKVLIIHGAGDKAFAAGTDIAQFRDFGSEQHAIDYEQTMDDVLGQIERCPIPTIAAINGACTGGGAIIACAADIRLASASFRFGFPIARTLGNCLSAANLARVANLIGPGRTREMIFTSRLMEAEEAERVGLISGIHSDKDSLLNAALSLAEVIATRAPLTLRATKEIQRRMAEARVEDRDWIVACYTSEDFREGLEAFLDKRQPNWKGR